MGDCFPLLAVIATVGNGFRTLGDEGEVLFLSCFHCSFRNISECSLYTDLKGSFVEESRNMANSLL